LLLQFRSRYATMLELASFFSFFLFPADNDHARAHCALWQVARPPHLSLNS
jgi:hypothetical protein